MAREITITLYKFNELNDAAKKRAINDCRNHPSYMDYDWWIDVYDDFIQIVKLLEIELDTRTVRQGNGKPREEPRIHFTGFCSQRDGASWFGSWNPSAEGTSYQVLIKAHAPRNTKLHQIAAALDSFRDDLFGPEALGHDRVAAWDLNIRVVQTSSHYCHENTMTLGLGYGPHVYLLEGQSIDQDEWSSTYYQIIAKVVDLLEGNHNSWNDGIIDIFRDLARWLYRQLKEEYDYLNSDAAVADYLEGNGYEFTADGAEYLGPGIRGRVSGAERLEQKEKSNG